MPEKLRFGPLCSRRPKMDNRAFRDFGHDFVDWVADYLDGVEKYPVLSRVKPGEIKAGLPVEPPLRPEPMEKIFADFREIVLPGITHWQHPGWFGYFPATLCALLSAREKTTGFSSNQVGFKGGLAVYASDQTHSSIEKGVKIAGFGIENLRLIPTDDAYAMIPEKLEAAIAADKDRGLTPACVVATIGTTSSTAVDPLAAIGRICGGQGGWLPGGGAFAG